MSWLLLLHLVVEMEVPLGFEDLPMPILRMEGAVDEEVLSSSS